MALAVDRAVGMTFVDHAAVGPVAFECRFGDPCAATPRASEQFVVAQCLSRSEKEPRCFDVVTERYVARMAVVPCFVEKEPEMPVRSHDAREEEFEQMTCLTAQPLLRGVKPQQIGIPFEDMQMRVHRFVLVGVLVAQADILQGGPVAGRRLEVAVVLQIERMGLNGFEEPPCLLRRTRVIRRACVFAQSVNGESQRIELLARIGRRAVGTYRPIDSAEFRVDEVVE